MNNTDKKTAKIIALKRALKESHEFCAEAREHVRLLEKNLEFWKKRYYCAQNQLSERGLTPQMYTLLLGDELHGKYKVWEVEQLANSKLRVELTKSRQQVHDLVFRYIVNVPSANKE